VPNNYIKSEQYVNLGLAALVERALLPNYFTRISGDAFANAQDDTLYWKGARVTTARDYEWRTRTAPIVLDKIGQTRVSITLDTHIYNGIPVTVEELTLDIGSFANDIVTPQIDAVITRIEQKIVLGLRAADFKTAIPAVYENDDPYKFAVSIRALLNKQGAPTNNRVFFIGTDVETWLLTSDRIAPAGLGTSPDVVRNASLGRLAGFDIVPVPGLADNEIFAVTPSTLVIANGAPALPLGAAQAARRNYRGWSLLQTTSWDTMYQRDISVLSTFLGVNSVEDELTTSVVGGFRTLTLDGDGNPIPTGKNVRGAKGTLTAGDRP
jgi:P22 coat protein - gene protein 5